MKLRALTPFGWLVRGCITIVGFGFVGLCLFVSVITMIGASTTSEQIEVVAEAEMNPTTAIRQTPAAPSPTKLVVKLTTLPTNEPTVVLSEHFDRENWESLISDPNAHKGASVEIVGRVFTAPERIDDMLGIQMWANPKNDDWSTLVAIRNTSLKIKQDDYVRVRGTVRESFSGENGFGATITVPIIDANEVEIVDAVAAASPAIRTADLGELAEQVQHNIHFTVQKIEFAADETRVFVMVRNESQETAIFYDFNAKAVQGSKQYDAETYHNYAEVQSELLPGIESSGIVLFPAINPAAPTKFRFEAHSNDYSLDFTPYIFGVTE